MSDLPGDALDEFMASWGRQAKVVAKTPISRGQANEGIVIYELDWASEHQDHLGTTTVRPPRRVVRKRTNRIREYQVACLLKEHRALGERSRCLPDVYFAQRQGSSIDLFLEYIPEVGVRPSRPGLPAARAITRGLTEIRGISPIEPEKPTVARVLRRRKRKIEKWVKEGVLTDVDASSLFDVYHASRRALKQSEVVVCHNDVGWPNCSVTSRSRRARFIDFTLLGYNTEGAELHLMLRDSVLMDSLSFFEKILNECSRRWSVEKSLLAAGCVEYAIYRGLQRVRRNMDRNNWEKVKKEMDFLKSLNRVHLA